MTEPRKLKKSESLEIRIPHPTKEAFMARCREEGRSASEALRAFIDSHLDERAPDSPATAPVRMPPRRLQRLIAGALIAAGMAAVAAPTLALSSPRAAFERLDANGDDRISLEEFSRGVSVDVRFSTGLASTGERLGPLPVRAVGGADVRAVLLRAEFGRIDADGDGAISFDEYRRRYDASGR